MKVELSNAEERLRFHVGLVVDRVLERITEVDCADLDKRKTVGTAFVGGVHDPRLSV